MPSINHRVKKPNEDVNHVSIQRGDLTRAIKSNHNYRNYKGIATIETIAQDFDDCFFDFAEKGEDALFWAFNNIILSGSSILSNKDSIRVFGMSDTLFDTLCEDLTPYHQGVKKDNDKYTTIKIPDDYGIVKPISNCFIVPKDHDVIKFINLSFIGVNDSHLISTLYYFNNECVNYFFDAEYETDGFDVKRLVENGRPVNMIAWCVFFENADPMAGKILLGANTFTYPDWYEKYLFSYLQSGYSEDYYVHQGCYMHMNIHTFVLNFYKYLTSPSQIVYAPQPETVESTRKMKASEKLNLKSYTFLDVKPEVIIKKEPVGTHRSPEPHLRRGHYRRQRYGKGLELEKLIFIPELKVNELKEI